MKARYFAACAILVAAGFAATILAWPQLPERIPLHWNVHGEVDGWGPRGLMMVLGPGAMLAELAIFALLPVLSPKRFALESFTPTYLRIMLGAILLAGYITAVLLFAGLTGHVDVSAALLGGVSVLLVFIGNLMGKVRRNFFIGIRTPWTLASERVWYATHRLAGKTIVATGIASFAAALWGGLAGTLAWIALVLAGVLVPVAYSFVHYKALERDGALGV
ncbi:MAG TPA: SdpI family protein [Usitatibacter sp.]|nr:SdpI family protein [Usitatibacter sp.]